MPHARRFRADFWLGGVILAGVVSVIVACSLPSFVPGGSSVSAQMTAAKGGSLTHNGATLSVPPHALAADATVTLADTGAPAHAKDDPLLYVSDGFTVSTLGTNGKTVPFVAPATLSLTSNSTIGGNVQDLIVAEVDPGTPQVISLHQSASAGQGTASTGAPKTALVASLPLATKERAARGARLTGSQSVSYPYSTPNTVMWEVGVVSVSEQPQENDVLQVPFYHQSGLGWCVPTSLSAMLRYYDFTPSTGDPINATYGSDLALANWQIAARSQQSAGSWANYGELANIGIPAYDSSTGIGAVGYLWDVNLVVSLNGAKGGFNDFQAYVVEVNTGLFGLGERKPLMLANDAAGHSLVIVGVDADDIYLHDSNGAIAEKLSWSDFQAYAQSATLHDIYTEVAYGYPIRPANLRTGSIVFTQGDLSDAVFTSQDTVGNLTWLDWDGASPHSYGYYLADPSYKGLSLVTQALGYHLVRGVAVVYKYRIANVTNVPLTYTSVAELSGPTFGVGLVSQSHTVTVPAYALSGWITGHFTPPSTGDGAFVDVKLFEVGSGSVMQDVKFVRMDVHDAPAPTVTIAQPANGTHVYAGTDVVFSGSGFDTDSGNQLPDGDLSWSIKGSPIGYGSSVTYSFASTGSYTVKLTGTDAAKSSGSASVTVTVDPAPPNPVVNIVSPTNGEDFNVPSTPSTTSYPVQLTASGSPGMQFSWSDSLDGFLGTGSSFTANLSVQYQGNCAPETTHTITLTGKDNLNRTKTAQVTVYLRPTCIN